MLLKVIDKLLYRSSQKEPDFNRLNRLESDVWRQIRKNKVAQNTIIFMLPVWSNKQLRYASLVLALIGGVMMSQASVPTISGADALGLEIFSPNTPFLISTTFEHMDSTSS